MCANKLLTALKFRHLAEDPLDYQYFNYGEKTRDPADACPRRSSNTRSILRLSAVLLTDHKTPPALTASSFIKFGSPIYLDVSRLNIALVKLLVKVLAF